MTFTLGLILAIIWYGSGFGSYVYWELRHRAYLRERWRPEAGWAPPIGPGLVMALMGPLLWPLGYVARPQTRKRPPGPTPAQLSRERPAQADAEPEDEETARPRVVDGNR